MTLENAEQTTLRSYNLVYTGDGTDTVPTAFPLGITSGDMNLMLPKYGGSGTETKANRLCFLFLADQAGTGTVLITGACDGGPEEPVCSVACTAGTIVETGTNIWVDTATLTTYHLAEDSIVLADSGNSHMIKLGYDNIGYRFMRFYTHTFTSITWIKIYARYF